VTRLQPLRSGSLSRLNRDELDAFVAENLAHLVEDEALAILDNAYCSAKICSAIARNARLTGLYTIRLRLVEHRLTPQAHSTKLVHYLFWPDLVRLSVDVQVPPAVRRAIDTQLVNRASKLSLGERISAARRCSQALIEVLINDSDTRVFEALLVNQRLREEDLVALARSPDVRPDQLLLIGSDPKWSTRYPLRKALVTNPGTPRAVAAAQLRFLAARDLVAIYARPETSTYLRRCIERLKPRGLSADDGIA
jgi:hypothetical protein